MDDFFPNLLTGFRVAEYNYYLEHFAELTVASAYPHFDEEWARYARAYPALAHRVLRYDPERLAGCRLAYLNFLNNAVLFLPALEAQRVPFVLTLYPGGGFGLGELESDAKLTRVLTSPLLRHVITTQRVTARYVRERLPRDVAMSEVFGVVANPIYFAPPPARTWFDRGKMRFDICFVAEKYMPRGENKGYPAFIEAATELAPRHREMDFHVVGGFEPGDIDVSALGGRIRFHGRLDTAALRSFLQGMDVIVSPNEPFKLHAGNFDGFPTGCCVEASLCGVAVVAADPLGLNEGRYRDGREFCLIGPAAADVVRALDELAAQPARIAAMGRAGYAVTRRLFDPATQLGRRQAIIEGELARAGA